MKAFHAHFDGERIVLPKQLAGAAAQDVIVVFEEAATDDDRELWMQAQEASLRNVWENDEDSVYDQL